MKDLKNTKNIILIILGALIILTASFIIYRVTHPTDAALFRAEYEKYNDADGYRTVNIPKKNPFIYATAEEIVAKVNNKETFMVYFGFSTCPWCRSIIEVLLDEAKSYGIDKIYYVDIKDIRNTREIQKDGTVTTTKKGSEGYMKLTELLADVLPWYELPNYYGINLKIDEKRIYAPYIISVVNGVAKDGIEGVSELQTEPNATLTEEILKDSHNIIGGFFKNYNDLTKEICSENAC